MRPSESTIRPGSRRRAAGLFAVALAGLVAWQLTGGAPRSLADTTTVSVTQGGLNLTPSANPQAGSPVTITESGQVGVTSTLDVFAQVGTPCAASQGQEVAGGAIHLDQRVVGPSPSPFTFTSEFTPATAATYFICGYLDGSSGGTQEDQSSSVAVVVAPAPPPPSGPASPGPAANPSVATPCTVPALARHSLAGARHLLASAGCSLGVVLRPSARGLRRERARPGGKSLVLVVGSQFPATGTRLRANQYVAIRLVLGRNPGGSPKASRK
jgi:hypothetical protein